MLSTGWLQEAALCNHSLACQGACPRYNRHFRMTGALIPSRLLSRFSWLHHGFGTRHDGLWTDALPSARLHQIHSDTIIRIDGPCTSAGDGDALITRTPGVWLSVRTADCVPILIADPASRSVAAIHAGWRGTAARIAGKTVERLAAEFQADPATFHAAIGPCIGACCYEVGPDVAAHFESAGQSPNGRPLVDLAAANARQLATAGVTAIDRLSLCTQCHPEQFHSFRRDAAQAGRMVSAICLA